MSSKINEQIEEASFASKQEIVSIERWYKVRREQILQDLNNLDNEYNTMIAECNIKWATRLLELHDSRRIQYKSTSTSGIQKTEELVLNDFDD
jgi:hypothetical protein